MRLKKKKVYEMNLSLTCLVTKKEKLLVHPFCSFLSEKNSGKSVFWRDKASFLYKERENLVTQRENKNKKKKKKIES